MKSAALIVLAGLPGVGKTSIAMELARVTGAVFLRVDSIELALGASGQSPATVGAGGYMVGYAIARGNLCLGRIVIADSVKPVQASRQAWRDVALETGSTVMEI